MRAAPVISIGFVAAFVAMTPQAIADGDDATEIVCFGGGAPGTSGGQNLGQSTVPPGIADAVQISGGIFHCAARLRSGEVVCWGTNDHGLGVGRVWGTDASGAAINNGVQGDHVKLLGQTLTGVVQVSAGELHTTALLGGGSVVQWGTLDYPVPAGLVATSVSAGSLFTMALKTDGRVVCWGRNYHGDCLGTDAGGNAISGTPDGSQTVRVLGAELQGVVQIAAGYEHATAIRQNGSVACWGRNDFGQRAVPGSLPSARQIDGGIYHTIVLGRNGKVYCWGDNSYGQSAGTLRGGEPDRSAGTGLRMVKINGVPLRRVEAIASGAGYHSIALLRDGIVVAWGAANPANPAASYGQSTVPESVQGRVTAIDGGYINTVLLTELLEGGDEDDGDEGEAECQNGVHAYGAE